MLSRKDPRLKDKGKKNGGQKKAGEAAPGRKGGKKAGPEGSGHGSMIIHGLDFRGLPGVSQGDSNFRQGHFKIRLLSRVAGARFQAQAPEVG